MYTTVSRRTEKNSRLPEDEDVEAAYRIVVARKREAVRVEKPKLRRAQFTGYLV